MSRQDDVQKLIHIYTRRLQKLQEQQALHGLSTPPAILIEIEDIEQKIEMLRADFEAAPDSDTSTSTPSQKMSDEDIQRELASLAPDNKSSSQVNIGGVNFDNISGSSINIGGNVQTTVEAGGDIVGGNKITTIHYHGQADQAPAEEKPRQPYEPEMVLIAAGAFTMGSDDDEPHESPAHPVTLPDYEIGKYPITNAQYFEYVKRAKVAVSAKTGWELARVGHAPPADKLDHPVVGISWDEAMAYCDWLSEQTGRAYRLPSEAEWEKAARGPDDARRYPWGDTWDDTRANTGDATTPVDQYPPQHPDGCCDMVGNVWEWTSTTWGRDQATPDFTYPYPPPDQPDDREASPSAEAVYREYRICRGGSYRNTPERLRCSTRARYAANSENARRGFRVARQVAKPAAQQGE